jgi:hypothetical protein
MTEERITKWFTDAVAIAFLSASGYANAFAYQAGYCDYFQLPKELVRIDVVGVLAASAAVGGTVFLALWIAKGFGDLLGEGHPILRTVAITGFMASLAIPNLVLGEWRQGPAPYIYGAFMGVVGREWLAPLLKHRDVVGYANKMRAYQAATHVSWSGTRILGWPLSFGFVVVATAWWMQVSYLVGRHDARTATAFLVTRDNPTLAVLRLYGETAVAVTFDEQTRSERVFERRKLGNLLPPASK